MDMNKGDTKLIIAECKKQGLLRNQAAYVLATAMWESAGTMKPVREYGGETYLKKKAYYPFVGMGYVQLTWKENYEKASKVFGVDFVKNPKLLLEPKYAAEIMVRGMRDAWFTKYKLSDFITLIKSDFFNARPIVNGDKNKVPKGETRNIGTIIADYAKQYDKQLKDMGYGEETISKPETGTGIEIPKDNSSNRRSWIAILIEILRNLLARNRTNDKRSDR